jgi:hypothetical protein
VASKQAYSLPVPYTQKEAWMGRFFFNWFQKKLVSEALSFLKEKVCHREQYCYCTMHFLIPMKTCFTAVKFLPPSDSDRDIHTIIMNHRVIAAVIQYYWVGVVDEGDKNDIIIIIIIILIYFHTVQDVEKSIYKINSTIVPSQYSYNTTTVHR